MANPVSSSTILLNVGVQALNLFLFFCIFYFGFAKKISESLQDRKDLMLKLENADDEYKHIVGNAELAAKEIIAEANASKKNMLDEATAIAKQKADAILDEASNKAEGIVETAQVQANALESDIKNKYEELVKTTAGSYLKKIFDTDKDMQETYIQKVSQGIL